VRYEFLELPGMGSALARPVIPVQVEDLEEAPQLCLVDSGATTNRFGAWIAEAVGVELTGAPEDTIVVGGIRATARLARANLTVAGTRYEAPVAFCEPWPFSFNLLGREGFLRFFRVTLCAKELWLDVVPEESS
jgi:hypothetical protein